MASGVFGYFLNEKLTFFTSIKSVKLNKSETTTRKDLIWRANIAKRQIATRGIGALTAAIGLRVAILPEQANPQVGSYATSAKLRPETATAVNWSSSLQLSLS